MDVTGVEDFVRFSKQVKQASKELQTERNKAILRATRPIKADIHQSLATNLPQRGGLARRAGKTKLTTRQRTSGKAAGVRIVARGDLSLYHMDKGQVRHRKDGKIDAGQVQRIAPGVATGPFEAAAPQVQREIIASMDAVAKKAVRGL